MDLWFNVTPELHQNQFLISITYMNIFNVDVTRANDCVWGAKSIAVFQAKLFASLARSG